VSTLSSAKLDGLIEELAIGCYIETRPTAFRTSAYILDP